MGGEEREKRGGVSGVRISENIDGLENTFIWSQMKNFFYLMQ